MKKIRRDIKWHIEDNKIVFDEPAILKDGETLVVEEIQCGEIIEIQNVFIETIDWEEKPPKFTVKILNESNNELS